MVLGTALRDRSLDEPIGEERLGLRVVKLGNFALHDQIGLAERSPELVTQGPVSGAVRAAVMIESDVEIDEIADVLSAHVVDQGDFAASLLSSPNHDRRAMGVVRPHENAPSAAELLKADPDVGLDVFDQMAQVDWAVGVRKCCCDKDFGIVH